MNQCAFAHTYCFLFHAGKSAVAIELHGAIRQIFAGFAR